MPPLDERVQKGIVWLGRAQALFGALAATFLGAVFIGGGVMKILREREPEPRDPTSALHRMDDVTVPSWALIVIGVIVLVLAWLWFWFTVKSPTAAAVEAVL